jgi:hypothetical protein
MRRETWAVVFALAALVLISTPAVTLAARLGAGPQGRIL